MKLLALSDIHGNLSAIRALRAAEENTFDAVVVAGDIGSDAADDFFAIVSTFECPVFYVYGNWDHEPGYRKTFAADCHLVHLRVLIIGGVAIAGFRPAQASWLQSAFHRASAIALQS